MGTKRFNAEQRGFLAEGAEAGRTAVEIAAELNARFGAAFTVAQVQRSLTIRAAGTGPGGAEPAGQAGRAPDPGAAPGRRVAEGTAAAPAERIRLLDTETLTPEAAERVMARFAARAVRGAERAFDMVDVAEEPRTLVAAVSAAKSLVALARVTLGLDTPVAAGAPGANFDFNFANTPLPPAPGEV